MLIAPPFAQMDVYVKLLASLPPWQLYQRCGTCLSHPRGLGERAGRFCESTADITPPATRTTQTTCLVFVIGAFLTWYVKWENKRRDRGDLDHRIEGLSEQEQQRLGYKHPSFR